MKWLQLLLLVGTTFTLASHLRAQDMDEPTAAVQLLCNYDDYGSYQARSATVLTSDSIAKTASSANVVRLSKDMGRAGVSITSGNFAECIYPNGSSVRVKVGMGVARAYGMCGGDPPLFLSIWVNRRKLDSRVWFAGHCSEAGTLVYNVSQDSVEKCQSAKPADASKSDSESLHVCVPFPATERFEIDEVEYPRGVMPPVGSIEIRSSKEAVCLAIKEKLTSNWDAFFGSEQPLAEGNLIFRESTAVFDPALRGSRESEFDFDNDGVANQVFSKQYENNYMHGSTLLIDPLMDAESTFTGGWFLPCQLDARSIPVTQCPPFVQAHDDAGFTVPNPGRGEIYFPARYSHLTPLRFKNMTYLVVTSESEDPREFVAVLKPHLDRTFDRTCLLRKIPENF
ncbi:MAG TPA: hypothetical protein VGN07_15780 [Steroidobacteraceae bacterium]|jgi:hypothetical protein